MTSSELNLPEELIDDLTSFYWKRVRKAIVEMEYHAISVDGLGTFKVKSWKLQEALEKYTRYTESVDTKTFNILTVKKEVNLRIERIKNLMLLFEKESEKKKLVKEKRIALDELNKETVEQ